MKEIIKKLPVPITGVFLGAVSLGNLLNIYSNVFRYIFGIIGLIILLLFLAKIVLFPNFIKETLDNPVLASVVPTFSMGLIIFSSYLASFSLILGKYTWFIGVILHAILIIIFTKKHIMTFNIKKVFASYFVVYVGIVCASVTAPIFGLESLGRGIFYFGFISYIILIPIVLYRVIIVKNIPEPALPTLTILTAPANLCLAGYFSSFSNINNTIVYFLFALSIIMLISVLFLLPSLLKLKFYPSFAAFTFPFVITAIGIRGVYNFFLNQDISSTLFKYFSYSLDILAFIMVTYVIAKYYKFIINTHSESIKEKKQFVK